MKRELKIVDEKEIPETLIIRLCSERVNLGFLRVLSIVWRGPLSIVLAPRNSDYLRTMGKAGTSAFFKHTSDLKERTRKNCIIRIQSVSYYDVF